MRTLTSRRSRIASTRRHFTGAERQVAQVVEDFESAVLADDVETICRDLLAVEENNGYDEDNGGFALLHQGPGE